MRILRKIRAYLLLMKYCFKRKTELNLAIFTALYHALGERTDLRLKNLLVLKIKIETRLDEEVISNLINHIDENNNIIFKKGAYDKIFDLLMKKKIYNPHQRNLISSNELFSKYLDYLLSKRNKINCLISLRKITINYNDPQ